jgi:integrase
MQEDRSTRPRGRKAVQPASPPRLREKVRPGIWRRRDAKNRWRYEIVYRASDGAQRRQTVTGGLREAETALADVKARMGRGEKVAPNPSLTFAVAAEKWLAAKSPNLAPKTIQTYGYALDTHLLSAFGTTRLDRVDVTAVSALIVRMSSVEYRKEVEQRNGAAPSGKPGYSTATMKAILIPLSRTFAYAKRNLGFAGENAVAALDLDERPGYRERKKKKPKLGRDQLDLLIAYTAPPWRHVVATAAALGTRMGETLGIEWRHVDFSAGVITIEQQANAKRKLAPLKTATSNRRIEAPDWLMAMLREVRMASPHSAEDDLVFCTATGSPHSHGNVLARGLYPALDRAGLPRTTFHSLRHTHASLWIKDGGDVITLSKRLGHANPQITMSVYADEIEEAADHSMRRARVNALFAGTQMAALMAAPDDRTRSQPALTGAAIVPLTARDAA